MWSQRSRLHSCSLTPFNHFLLAISVSHGAPTPYPKPRNIPSRITKEKELGISTLERRLCTARRCRSAHNHIGIRLRRHALRLLLIALPDRQALVAAGVSGLRARIMLVVAGADGGGLEIREAAAVDGEGGLAVACLGNLRPLTSLLPSSSSFTPL